MAQSTLSDAAVIRSSPARVAGGLLIAVSVLEIVAMARHPGVHTHDVAQAIAQLRAMGALSAWVHGLLITLMLLGFVALSEFACRRNLARLTIRTGLIAYAVGVAATTGAAVVSGFITPRVAMASAALSAGDLQLTAQLLNLCVLFNQALARLGVVALSAGIAAWSLDLARGPGVERALGVLGVGIGACCAGALLLGVLQLDVHGMLLVVVLQAIWSIGIGLLLWRGSDARGYQPMP